LPSSRRKPDARRKLFLKLTNQIGGQLREIYARKHAAGEINQTKLAEKLGINRSVVNRRLLSRANMTEESIADMIWALDSDFDLHIFECKQSNQNSGIRAEIPSARPVVWTSFGAGTPTTTTNPLPKVSVASS